MLALSIMQPWAYLILVEGKDIENRTWPTRVRGRVLVHAGLKLDSDTRFEMPDGGHGTDRGGIVGSVEIVDCASSSSSRWFNGPWGFVLRNPQLLPFRPMRGRLGFFEVPEDSP